MKVFDESCGYYGKQGYIARFERDLDHRDQVGKFRQAFQQAAGISWEEGREQALQAPAIGVADPVSNRRKLTNIDLDMACPGVSILSEQVYRGRQSLIGIVTHRKTRPSGRRSTLPPYFPLHRRRF